MRIHCTRGCVHDCITIDGKDIPDLDSEKRITVIDKIEKYVLEKGIKDYYIFDNLLAYIWDYMGDAIFSKYSITTDEETCEYRVEEKPLEDIYKGMWKLIAIDFFQFLRENTCDITQICLWFMEDYVGLKYQYHCDCCGDSVYSKTIKI